MDYEAIRTRIEVALRDDDHDETIRRDIAFHMTDWLSELEPLVRVYENPDRATDEEIAKALMDFLVHAPAHIAAAAKLYTGGPVEDIFNIGAVATSHQGSD